MNYYLQVIRNYVNFNGRARRKEYWMFTLFNLIFFIVAATLDTVLGINFSELTFYGPIYLVYALFVMLPSLAVGVRRLHDVSKSGWWLLITFIPIVGTIWILVLLATDSTDGENEYGPNPKQVNNDPLLQPEMY